MNTYYLDEDILINVPIVSVDYVRNNIYSVYKDNTVIFKGSTYIPKNSSSVNICVNDIVATYQPLYKPTFEGDIELSSIFKIALDDSLNGVSEVEFEVVYMYRYPNKYFDYSINKDVLLGDLKPRYPLKDTDNFTLGFVFKDIDKIATAPLSKGIIHFSDYEDLQIKNIPLSEIFIEGAKKVVYGENEIYVLYCHQIEVNDDTATMLINAGIPKQNITKVLNDGYGVLISDSNLEYVNNILSRLTTLEAELEIQTSIVSGKVLAYLDECYNRYYLKWIDRKGGIQCQPFKMKHIYSEDFENAYIRNSLGHQRKVYWDITSKWSLNTDWVDSDNYAIYESIFISPYLQLYDTELDKVFNVNVENNTFTAKNYKNEGKMFNFSINLIADKNQEIFK